MCKKSMVGVCISNQNSLKEFAITQTFLSNSFQTFTFVVIYYICCSNVDCDTFFLSQGL